MNQLIHQLGTTNHVDSNLDPELDFALRFSMEEEKARQEAHAEKVAWKGWFRCIVRYGYHDVHQNVDSFESELVDMG